jgi:hypothetical protein
VADDFEGATVSERLAKLGDALQDRPSVRDLVVVDALAIIALGTLGALQVFTSLPIRGFWLDGEVTYVPAVFSAALLVAAAVVAAAVAQRERGPATRRALAGIAVLFAYMSLDELMAIHEEFQYASGIPWQAFYVPLIAFAAVGWFRILGRLREVPRAAALWIAAAGAWGIAQVLDLIETEAWLFEGTADVDSVGLNVLIVIEEMLEMVGSSLFALALLFALRRLGPRPAA